jgi:hypothetical protein
MAVHHFKQEYQKSKVYAWERKHIPEGKTIAFEDAQAYVNHVWAQENLRYPPIVKEMPKQTRRFLGRGNREAIWIPSEGASEHTILHELAHTLTMTVHGAAEPDDTAHGADFVGTFIQLVGKHLNMSTFMLWHACTIEGIDFEMFPKPKINMVG